MKINTSSLSFKWSLGRYGSIPVRLIFTWMSWNIYIGLLCWFCQIFWVLLTYRVKCREWRDQHVLTLQKKGNEINWNVYPFGHNDFTLCFLHLHPAAAALNTSAVACFCGLRINSKAAMKTSSNLITWLITLCHVLS